MTDLVGKHFQGYRILGQVGPGAGSNIFKASTPQGNEIVAIKFLSPQVGRNRQLIDKLRTSFQAAIRLNHPLILQMKSFDVHSGYPYVIMPYMDAGSLDDRIEFGALGAINVLAVIRDVASVLDVAHTQGLVHGDLKPSNILFDEDGNVLLNGLGEAPLASMRANQLRDEREGRTSYQAPEVMAGDRITPAADQYSLGLIALEMLTRLPADEALNAMETIRRYGGDTVTMPSPYALDLSSRMIEFLSRTLSHDPAERFSTMKEWNRAFMEAFSNEEPPSEPETEAVQVAQKKPRRNRLVLLAPILALIICLVVAVPALTSPGEGALGGFLTTLGLFKEESTSVVASTEDWSGGGIALGTPVPEGKNANLDDHSGKATSIPDTMDEPVSGGGGEDTLANTLVPPAKTDPPKELAATQSPQDQATATITFTPTPTQTEEGTATVTSPPTFTEPAPTDTPAADPTINPALCSRKKKDENYCTPTPKP